MQPEFANSNGMCVSNDSDLRSYINLLQKWTLNINSFAHFPEDVPLSQSNTTTSSNTSTRYAYCLKQLHNLNFNSDMTPVKHKETKISSLSKASSSSSSLSSSPSSSSTTSSSSSSYTSYQYETNFLHSNFVKDNHASHHTSKRNTAHLSGNVKNKVSSGTPPCSLFAYAMPQQNVQTNDNVKNVNNETTNKCLIYRDGNLISGDFSALVQHLVPTLDYYPDRAYLFTFLLTSRLFTTPYELFVNIIAICDAQQNIDTQYNIQRLVQFVPRLMQLIKEWSELFPRDFQDENLLNYAISVMEKCVSINVNLRGDMNTLLSSLVKRVYNLEHYEEYIANISATSVVDCMHNLDTLDTFELCSNPRTVAECLCHIELNRLAYISSEEFVQEYSKNKHIIEAFYKSAKRLQSFKGYIEWFNKLSLIVATEICKHNRKKNRSKTIEFWVEIARECFNIGNFNSLMAIISGLNMSPVVRLKKTWNKVQSGKFSILEHQMDPTSNFSSYRSTLKAAMWRSAGTTDKMQQIIIPFFSLLIKDIYFLNECCVNRLPNGHINFEKFWHLAKQVTEFMAWKQVTCPFPTDQKIIAFLQECAVLSINALTLVSFECEPPDNNVEKDQYKSLKLEAHQ